MSRYSTARYFLEGLNELGIDYIFCNMGTDHAPIIEEMARCQKENRRYPQPILCPHENVAIHMAHGFAIASGRAQAVMVHVDVGTGNIVNGAHNLSRSRTPALLLAGKVPYSIHGELPGGRDLGAHFVQELYDMASIVRPFVKWEYNLPSGLVVKEVLRRAYSIMNSDPKGLAFLTLPREVLAEEWDESRIRSFPKNDTAPPQAPDAGEEVIGALAERLLAAGNAMIVTAYSGRNPACPAVLQELAELLGIRVFEHSRLHFNLANTSPCYAGPVPPDLSGFDLGLLVDVDVPWVPSLFTEGAATYWVHLDVDTVKKDLPLWGFPSHMRIQADSYKVLTRLLEAIRERLTPAIQARCRERFQRLEAERAAADAKFRTAAADRGQPGQINPAYLCAEMNKVIAAEDMVVNEAVRNAAAVITQIKRTQPGSYLGEGGGGLGWSGGAALGVRLAKPNRRVFHFCGDGSFYFGNPSAVYAVSKKYGLPIFTVVLDNFGWAAVKASTLRMYPAGIAQELNEFRAVITDRPQLDKIAEAFGAYGETVHDPADVPAAIARCMDALNQGRSALLVAHVPCL